MKTKDHPGVLIPPPMIYAAVFGLAAAAQSLYTLRIHLLESQKFRLFGWLLILVAASILIPSLWRFLQSRNTLITIKPANSLQTTGIYAYSRNPMYLGLLILYAGLACLSGNCWTLLFLPVLILVIHYYIILREERYLERAFPEDYLLYKSKVRRWL